MSQDFQCRVCGNAAKFEKVNILQNGYELFKCSCCSTVMTLQIPGPLELQKQYDELFEKDQQYQIHRTGYSKLLSGKIPLEYHRQNMLRRVMRISPVRRMVEIGGGLGTFGFFAVKNGWDYLDIDISLTAIEKVSALGLKAEIIDLGKLSEMRNVVVAMWEVIEHIWNVSEYLAAIRMAIEPDGLLLLSTPNFLRKSYRSSKNWGAASVPPIHVNFFTEDSLRKSLEAAGFSSITIFKPRLNRPSASLKSVLYSVELALGIEPTKNLYVIAKR